MIRKRLTAVAILTGLLITTFAAAPSAVYASAKGRKNTALLLGGAAAYSLVKKKPTQGLVLGAAGLYAYKRYKDKKSQDRARIAARRAYARGYRSGRATGSRTVRYARARR
jgi:chromate transport protein ChrA